VRNRSWASVAAIRPSRSATGRHCGGSSGAPGSASRRSPTSRWRAELGAQRVQPRGVRGPVEPSLQHAETVAQLGERVERDLVAGLRLGRGARGGAGARLTVHRLVDDGAEGQHHRAERDRRPAVEPGHAHRQGQGDRDGERAVRQGQQEVTDQRHARTNGLRAGRRVRPVRRAVSARQGCSMVNAR